MPFGGGGGSNSKNLLDGNGVHPSPYGSMSATDSVATNEIGYTSGGDFDPSAPTTSANGQNGVSDEEYNRADRELGRLEYQRSHGGLTSLQWQIYNSLRNMMHQYQGTQQAIVTTPPPKNIPAWLQLIYAWNQGVDEGGKNVGGALRGAASGVINSVLHPVDTMEGLIDAIDGGVTVIRQIGLGNALKNVWGYIQNNPSKVAAEVFAGITTSIVTGAATNRLLNIGKGKPPVVAETPPTSGSAIVTPSEGPLPFGGKPVQIGPGIDPPAFNPPKFETGGLPKTGGQATIGPGVEPPRGNGSQVGLPAPRSLTNIQARDWYNARVAQIDAVEQQMRAAGKSPKEIFETTTRLRNEAKLQARELMQDQARAQTLPRPLTPEEILQKYGGDYEKAIAASKRTNPEVNQAIEELRRREGQ